MNNFKFAAFLLIPILLSACKKDTAQECLESFRNDLVSPNSAKVLKFDGEKLSYLAKNRNGVEVQGRAICRKIGEEFVRDSSAEYIEVLSYHTNSLKENNECRVSFKNREYCDENHKVISIDIARIYLGYN